MRKSICTLIIAFSLMLSGCTYENKDTNVIQNSSRIKTIEYEATIIPINRININSCSRTALINVDGIGKVKAEKIFKARPLRNMEDVEEIKGLGRKAILEIEKRVVFDGISNTTTSPKYSNNS